VSGSVDYGYDTDGVLTSKTTTGIGGAGANTYTYDGLPIAPLVNWHMLARLIPDARGHVVRGGGHLFLLERLGEMAGLVTRFLNG
jgi:hypothetical protein